MILARLLDPRDFGLVGMVTAVIGVFSVLRDFGLSAAAVQRTVVTREQASTLFWINVLVGASLACLSVIAAPFVAAFYHEPRLIAVTCVLASGFLFNAAGVQHSAILERQMRFTTLSIIDVVSLLAGSLTAIAMAMRNFGYWSLAASSTATPLAYTLCVWIASSWIPGRPRGGHEIRSMIRFGGTLTANSLVMYITTNFEKVLLGRFWGADAIGLYGRAYQLVNIPNDNLNSAATGVAFPTLSRLKDHPPRFRSYFLKAYSLIVSLTVPITVTSALFASDMISVFLGPKWASAVPIFRLLAPTTLAFAIINPTGWLLMSLGLVNRGLKIALVLAPVMITGYLAGLSFGPRGVAFAYSAMMVVCAIPIIAWAVHGTVVSLGDILGVVSRPLLSGLVAAMVGLAAQAGVGAHLPALARLILDVTLVMAAYLAMLMWICGQKAFYVDTIRSFRKSSPNTDATPESFAVATP